MVGQIGFSYKDDAFAEQILYDELIELSNAGISDNDFDKLINIYEYYLGKKFKKKFVSKDEREQKELENFYKKTKSKDQIRNDLINLKSTDPEEVIVHHKSYKRDNKIIAQLKILRDFKC
jgi:putative restriction endonuclease